MTHAKEIEEALLKADVPEHVKPGLLKYILYGCSVGHFLTAVLGNDLKGAVGHADEENTKRLPQIVRFLYTYAPHVCWGSVERVVQWKEKGGLLGREQGSEAQGQDSQVAVRAE